jgi:hypothetical protein
MSGLAPASAPGSRQHIQVYGAVNPELDPQAFVRVLISIARIWTAGAR